MFLFIFTPQSLLLTSSTCLQIQMSSASQSPGESPGEDPNKQRQSNLQRIQQRKQSVRNWPKEKKLEKLAIYSSCKEEEDCKCNGWKNPNPPPNPPKYD